MRNRLAALAVLSASLSACGGGGGGNNTSDACRSYCDYGCQKVANCHAATSFDLGACSDACFNKLDGTTTQLQCGQDSTSIAVLTCAQLDTLLGLRSAAIRSSADIDAYEVGTEVASKAESLGQ
jgi:hypothetical protein